VLSSVILSVDKLIVAVVSVVIVLSSVILSVDRLICYAEFPHCAELCYAEC